MAVTLATGGVPAGSICAGGVLGDAVTVKVRVCPSSRVAVTVHVSAEAVGMAATAITTSTSPTVVNATLSLWLIDTVVLFPPATYLDHAELRTARVTDANGWQIALQRRTVA